MLQCSSYFQCCSVSIHDAHHASRNCCRFDEWVKATASKLQHHPKFTQELTPSRSRKFEQHDALDVHAPEDQGKQHAAEKHQNLRCINMMGFCWECYFALFIDLAEYLVRLVKKKPHVQTFWNALQWCDVTLSVLHHSSHNYRICYTCVSGVTHQCSMSYICLSRSDSAHHYKYNDIIITWL